MLPSRRQSKQEARTRDERQGTTPHHTLAPHLHALCDTIPRCPVDFRIRDHLALLDRVLCLVSRARVYVSEGPIKGGMHMQVSCTMVCEGREGEREGEEEGIRKLMHADT